MDTHAMDALKKSHHPCLHSWWMFAGTDGDDMFHCRFCEETRHRLSEKDIVLEKMGEAYILLQGDR